MISKILKPGKGIAFVARKKFSTYICITDLEGQQVSDLVAFSLRNGKERLSGTQTNKLNARLNLKKGDILYSTSCKPMFEIYEITNPKVHYNFIFSPCGVEDNKARFPGKNPEPTCIGALTSALQEKGYENIPRRDLLEPFSMGLHLHQKRDGTLETRTPLSKPGDYITLIPLMDSIVAISCCPQYRNQCNGEKPTPVNVLAY